VIKNNADNLPDISVCVAVVFKSNKAQITLTVEWTNLYSLHLRIVHSEIY